MARKRLSKSSLLWFVRSRSFVTVPDIRRRFGVETGDDVSVLQGPDGKAFVGLPSPQARMLQDLWQEGKVGLEFVADINARSVSGVFSVYTHRDAMPARSGPGGQGDATDADDED
jgi:hypothetical protein